MDFHALLEEMYEKDIEILFNICKLKEQALHLNQKIREKEDEHILNTKRFIDITNILINSFKKTLMD